MEYAGRRLCVNSGVLLVMLSWAAGCTQYDNDVFRLHLLVAEAEQSIVQENDWQQTFSPRQLEALIGKPEKVASVEDFLAMAGEGDPEAIDHCRRRIAHSLSRYLTSDRGAADLVQPSPEDMKKCEVWLYRWTDPAVVKLQSVGGTVIFVTAKPVIVRQSYAYAIFDSHVIDCMSLDRKEGRTSAPGRTPGGMSG